MTSTSWQISPSSPLDIKDPAALRNLHFVKDVTIQAPGPGQVRVCIHAAGLNFRDMQVIAHDPKYGEIAEPELTPCCDGAGVVDAAGPGSVWQVGDRVITTPCTWLDGIEPDLTTLEGFGSGKRQGTLREHIIVEDEFLIRMPSHFTFEDAAAFLGAGATAYRTLMTGEKPLRKGDVVVTQGTGGVSMSNIQMLRLYLLTCPNIASAYGATVIATSSSDAKLQEAKALGATFTVNYKTHPNWSSEVLRLTGNRGADHVVNLAGSATMLESIKAVRKYGTVHLVGLLNGNDEPISVLHSLLFGGITLRGVLLYSRQHCEAVRDFFARHLLKPAVGKVFGYLEAKKAFGLLLEQQTVGKIVISMDEKYS